MNKAPDHPSRKHLPHLPAHEPGNRTIIQYVTVCVDKRRPLLARPEIAALFVRIWSQADRWHVGRFVLMPDHLHLFCAPAVFPATSLQEWVEYWRGCCSRFWPHEKEKPVWQRGFFDHQLRTGESYSEKCHYVRENPVRAGLVAQSDSWPFQGEMYKLSWHDVV
jgi:putative transposase